MLVVLFLAALLLPGVDGLLGEAGAGRERGARQRLARAARSRGPMDADRVAARSTATLALEPDAVAAVEAPLSLVAVFRTSRPLPEALPRRASPCSSTIEAARGSGPGAVAARRSARSADVRFDLAQLEALKPHLTPGKHRARVRLVPHRRRRSRWRS